MTNENTDLIQVLICTGANATGQCIYKKYELDHCYDLEPPFAQNSATFAPDGEDFFCYPRTGKCSDICTSPTGCTFGPVDFNFEHKFNLTANGGWNAYIGHFDCKAKKTGSQ